MTAAAVNARFGALGAIVGLLALAAAALPLWVLPAVFPPKPVDAWIVDTAQKVRQRAVARERGIEDRAVAERSPAAYWGNLFSITAVSLGLLATALAVLSFLRREPARFGAVAAALGLGAIAFEFLALALCAMIGTVLILAVVRYLAIG